jgi:hypothetical protein
MKVRKSQIGTSRKNFIFTNIDFFLFNKRVEIIIKILICYFFLRKPVSLAFRISKAVFKAAIKFQFSNQK